MTRFVGRYDPEKKKMVWDDGDEPPAAPAVGTPSISTAYSRPLASQALGCHAEQVSEFNEKAAKGIRYLPDGTCQIESRAARNEELKRRGFKDFDAGYGDFC